MAGKTQSKTAVAPRAKLWLEVDGNYAFGHGIACILEAVAETGSIKAASASVGKSYRHVWSRIKEAEQALNIPLVETQVGGGKSRRSSLTEPARQLVDCYTQMREQIFEMVKDQFSSRVQEIVSQASQQSASS